MVHIRCKRAETAQRALESIYVALHVLSLEPFELYEMPEVTAASPDAELPSDNVYRSSYHHMQAGAWRYTTSGILLACAIAARCSRRRSFAYALHLLGFSQSVAAVHIMDLEPGHWRSDRAVSPYERDHVRLATAIVTAYGAIEQLGLEVRASNARPTFRNGSWNPEVRLDLEKRLKAAGVNLSETMLWTQRGAKRRIESLRPARALRRAEWAWGQVRDLEVEVVDAIADASWLRSKVASHRLREAVGSLTIYDVHNAQSLARRLLMESVGLWRWADD